MAVTTGTALLVGGALAAGGAAYSSYQANKSQERATDAQVASARSALELEKIKHSDMMARTEYSAMMGDRALKDYYAFANRMPVTSIPELDLTTMEEAAAVYQDLPGYQEALKQGIRAIDMSASATGRGGGALQKELFRYGSDYSTNTFFPTLEAMQREDITQYNADVGAYNTEWSEWQNKMSPFASIAGLGHSAIQHMNQLDMATASRQGNIMMAAGDAQAQGYTNRQSIVGNALTGLGNTAMTYGMYKGAGLMGNTGTSGTTTGKQLVSGMTPAPAPQTGYYQRGALIPYGGGYA